MANNALLPYELQAFLARLDEQAKAKGMSRAEVVVDRAGLNARTLRRWDEEGRIPTVENVKLIAEVLETTYEDFTKGLSLRRDSRPPASNGYDPWQPADPICFVGRKVTLGALRERLEAKGSVNVVGDRRIGKSSLLKMWAAQAREIGHH